MPSPNLPIKTGHLFIGLAVIMGIATVGVFSSGKQEAPKAQVKVETLDVVVPLSPINEGQTLSRNDITIVKWPSAYIPTGNVFSDPMQVVGRIAKQNLFPGEPIFLQKVSGSNTSGGLPAVIPKGMRAVTVGVSEVKGVAGFVKPGDRVDILTTFDVSHGEGEPLKTTKTVLQDVLVLASAQTMVRGDKYNIDTPEGVTRGEAVSRTTIEEPSKKKSAKERVGEEKVSAKEMEKRAKEREKERKDAEKAARLVSSVTLALTPEQSETLALAEEMGDIRLVLRPEADHSVAELNGTDSSKLLGTPLTFQQPPQPSSADEMPAMPTPMLGTQVEFIQGEEKTLYSF